MSSHLNDEFLNYLITVANLNIFQTGFIYLQDLVFFILTAKLIENKTTYYEIYFVQKLLNKCVFYNISITVKIHNVMDDAHDIFN